MLRHLLGKCVKVAILLICSSGTVANVDTEFFFFFAFSLPFVLFFLLNIYKNPHIYCYTNTTNFTIFSQLLRCRFLINQNKIIKYETWPTTTENKCFEEML